MATTSQVDQFEVNMQPRRAKSHEILSSPPVQRPYEGATEYPVINKDPKTSQDQRSELPTNLKDRIIAAPEPRGCFLHTVEFATGGIGIHDFPRLQQQITLPPIPESVRRNQHQSTHCHNQFHRQLFRKRVRNRPKTMPTFAFPTSDTVAATRRRDERSWLGAWGAALRRSMFDADEQWEFINHPPRVGRRLTSLAVATQYRGIHRRIRMLEMQRRDLVF